MRDAQAVTVEADDPIAPTELKALADQQGWLFTANGENLFALKRADGGKK